MHISRFVLENQKAPLNPFMLFDYFLVDSIDRNLVRDANNSIVLRCDEIWCFGPISNGVLAEILLARKANKPVSYFKIEKSQCIVPITIDLVEMETDVESFRFSLYESSISESKLDQKF
jgi:hypothetical protein